MKAWINLSEEAHKKLIEKGRLVCDDKKYTCVECSDYERAYDFMIASMAKRGLKKPHDAISPMWCHTRINGVAGQKPEPWHWSDGVLLELDIPTSLVLESDESMWSCVLNGANLDNIEKSNDDDKLESWSKIFNTSEVNERSDAHLSSIQGVFWELKSEYITSTERARRPIKEYTLEHHYPELTIKHLDSIKLDTIIDDHIKAKTLSQSGGVYKYEGYTKKKLTHIIFFKDGRQYGEFLILYPNGDKKAWGVYTLGCEQGEAKSYYLGNRISSKVFYLHGMLRGQAVEWNPDGTISSMVMYEDDDIAECWEAYLGTRTKEEEAILLDYFGEEFLDLQHEL